MDDSIDLPSAYADEPDPMNKRRLFSFGDHLAQNVPEKDFRKKPAQTAKNQDTLLELDLIIQQPEKLQQPPRSSQDKIYDAKSGSLRSEDLALNQEEPPLSISIIQKLSSDVTLSERVLTQVKQHEQDVEEIRLKDYLKNGQYEKLWQDFRQIVEERQNAVQQSAKLRIELLESSAKNKLLTEKNTKLERIVSQQRAKITKLKEQRKDLMKFYREHKKFQLTKHQIESEKQQLEMLSKDRQEIQDCHNEGVRSIAPLVQGQKFSSIGGQSFVDSEKDRMPLLHQVKDEEIRRLQAHLSQVQLTASMQEKLTMVRSKHFTRVLLRVKPQQSLLDDVEPFKVFNDELMGLAKQIAVTDSLGQQVLAVADHVGRPGDSQEVFYEQASLSMAAEQVVSGDQDVLVGIVGDSNTGKYFTSFGIDNSQVGYSQLYEDMRGVLPRLIEDLLYFESELNIGTTKVKTYARFGYLEKSPIDGKLQMPVSSQFTRVEDSYSTMSEIYSYIASQAHFKRKVWQIQFKVEKKIYLDRFDTNFLTFIRFPSLQSYISNLAHAKNEVQQKLGLKLQENSFVPNDMQIFNFLGKKKPELLKMTPCQSVMILTLLDQQPEYAEQIVRYFGLTF